MPRALIVVHSYYMRDTRPRRHAAILTRAGYQVDVICARDEGESHHEDVGGIHIQRLPARRKRGSKLRYMFEYASFTLLAWMAVRSNIRLRGGRPDVVIVIGIPNLLVAAAAPARRKGSRVLLDMRDPLPEFFVAKYGITAGSLAHRLLLAEERWSCRRCDEVLTVVPSMARLYERSKAPDRIRLIMNAPDTRMFKRVEVARDADDRTMLYAGTVAARYGVDLAVRAVGRLRDEIPGISLRIVGDGDLVEACRRIAQEEGVADRVEFLAPVPLDKVPAMVAEAWLGVQPNRHDALMEHSLSTKILEWASLRLPVVVGETAPLADVFGREGTIWMHEPGDLDGLCAAIRQIHTSAAPVLEARLDAAAAAAASVDFKTEAASLIAAVRDEAAPARTGNL